MSAAADHQVLSALKAAADGVTYPSEQDNPIEAFLWPAAKGRPAPCDAGSGKKAEAAPPPSDADKVGDEAKSTPASLDAETIRKQAKAAPDAPVETQPVDDFLAPIVTPQSWHGDEEKKAIQRGQQLAAALRQNLTDLQVFRVGDTDKKVYLVGKTADGDLAGVTTQVVET